MTDLQLDTWFCTAIGYTENRYNDLQLDTAENWLVHVFPSDPVNQANLRDGKAFWLWWRNQWASRNRVLYTETVERYTLEREQHRFVCTEFFHVHHIDNIREYPSVCVFENDYARMIGSLIDECHVKKVSDTSANKRKIKQ